LTAGNHQVQLEWEARVGRFAGAAAIGSALVTAVSIGVQLSAYRDVSDTDRSRLITAHEKSGEIWVSIALRDVALVLLAFALWYLLRTTRYRGRLPGLVAPLIPLAPVLLVAASIINQADVSSIASDFVESGRQTEARADDLLDDLSPAGAAVGAGGTLALALTLVLVSLHAMRVGLLSRFMGIIGILTGALLVLPLLPLPIFQIFWLGALGTLFFGRWPGGRGPAWESGESVPWPSMAEARERAVGERLGDQAEPEPAPELNPEPAPDQHPASKKRKRKRRR
jgi:hypothetical protein